MHRRLPRNTHERKTTVPSENESKTYTLVSKKNSSLSIRARLDFSSSTSLDVKLIPSSTSLGQAAQATISTNGAIDFKWTLTTEKEILRCKIDDVKGATPAVDDILTQGQDILNIVSEFWMDNAPIALKQFLMLTVADEIERLFKKSQKTSSAASFSKISLFAQHGQGISAEELVVSKTVSGTISILNRPGG